MRALLISAAVVSMLGAPALSRTQPDVAPQNGEAGEADAAPKETARSITHHEVVIGGETVRYTAEAGLIELPDYEGKPKANIFYVAYTRDGIESAADRPITFAFNGGPGSSSVWLHLGALGPRRVLMDEEGMPLPPPYRLVPNEQSWLDVTDLVFIDPVGTGYSRPAEGESASQFHGLDEDIRSVGDFIRLYTTRAERWSSPKFLAGESYGTTRAAGLSGYLQDTHGMYLNGIVFISSVLNFGTIRFDHGNDTPYWLYLPTYAATAWFHGRLAPDLQQDLERTLSEAEAWASTDYLVALGRGDAMTEETRSEVARRLSRFTGLSEDFVRRSNLRIEISEFTKELLRDEGRTVGRLDSRFVGIDRDGTGARPEYDPSYAAILGPYTATLNDYVRRDLGYENDHPYEILTGRVHPWSFASASNRYAEVGETLRSAMARNPDLRVMFASGYYDLATPYFASDYTVSHLGLDPAMRDQVTQTYYQSGHMMYIRVEDLRRLKADVAAFIGRAWAGSGAPGEAVPAGDIEAP